MARAELSELIPEKISAKYAKIAGSAGKSEVVHLKVEG